MSELFSVAGKVALITGGSRGIGLMIAKALVAAGAKVYLSSRKAAVCDQAAAELAALGECHSLPADLSKMSEVERLASVFGESITRARPGVHRSKPSPSRVGTR